MKNLLLRRRLNRRIIEELRRERMMFVWALTQRESEYDQGVRDGLQRAIDALETDYR